MWFSFVHSGILLPDGSGLYDPCEKEPTDVLNTLTLQDKENITASVQHTLRLIAFRQIHQVLNMEQLPILICDFSIESVSLGLQDSS